MGQHATDRTRQQASLTPPQWRRLDLPTAAQGCQTQSHTPDPQSQKRAEQAQAETAHTRAEQQGQLQAAAASLVAQTAAQPGRGQQQAGRQT